MQLKDYICIINFRNSIRARLSKSAHSRDYRNHLQNVSKSGLTLTKSVEKSFRIYSEWFRLNFKWIGAYFSMKKILAEAQSYPLTGEKQERISSGLFDQNLFFI